MSFSIRKKCFCPLRGESGEIEYLIFPAERQVNDTYDFPMMDAPDVTDPNWSKDARAAISGPHLNSEILPEYLNNKGAYFVVMRYRIAVKEDSELYYDRKIDPYSLRTLEYVQRLLFSPPPAG